MEALRGSEPLTKLGALEKGLFLGRFCEADLSDLARSEARNEILIYIHQSNSGQSSWVFMRRLRAHSSDVSFPNCVSDYDMNEDLAGCSTFSIEGKLLCIFRNSARLNKTFTMLH